MQNRVINVILVPGFEESPWLSGSVNAVDYLVWQNDGHKWYWFDTNLFSDTNTDFLRSMGGLDANCNRCNVKNNYWS